VKVLRFSVGFGKPLWTRRGRVDGTEFVIAALPLGGYVRMLDEREGEVPQSELNRAFNRKSVWARIAVVVAGPAANFAFAIVAYALMFGLGVTGLKPLVGVIQPGTPAYQSGFVERDLIVAVDGSPVTTWGDVSIALLESGMDNPSATVTALDDTGVRRSRQLPLGDVEQAAARGDLMGGLGLEPWSPPLPPVIDSLQPGGAGERFGLQPGDRVLAVDGIPMDSWGAWAAIIRANPETELSVEIDRGGLALVLPLVPDRLSADTEEIGRIGALGRVPEGLQSEMTVTVRYGPLAALIAGVERTWEMSSFTLRMLWRMLMGKASLENLSGPISIAQYAGQTASMGVTAFLSFLALISVSLGVLNLLPVPVLDGGHLFFYLIEVIKGSPLSEALQGLAQRAGLAVLLALMGLAFFNDIMRLTGN
jgi:regulator of sigma E protease